MIRDFQRKIRKNGNSLTITIPATTAQLLGLKEGQIRTFSVLSRIHQLPKETADKAINNPHKEEDNK